MKTDTQTVILTGGTGFLGSHILKKLLAACYRVLLLKRSSSDTTRIESCLQDQLLSLLDVSDNLETTFKDNKIDFVIHTATAYGRDNESDEDIQRANLNLPLELFKLAQAHQTKAFINSDTFFNEKLGVSAGESKYIKTKKDFLREAKELVTAGETKFVNLLLYQMYGPADNEHKFIPFIIKKLTSHADSIPLTPGEQTRDFVYVEDVAEAYLAALQNIDKLDQFSQFEIGTGQSHSLRQLVEMIKTKTNSPSQLDWGALLYRDNEIMESRANTANNATIDWKAITNLEAGLGKTVAYYKD